MPTYLARGISARLGAMPLTDTISPEIITNRKTDRLERLLRNSKLLAEVPVPFPGDDGQHRLNWLGDAPFIQVQARWDGLAEKCPSTTEAPIGFPTAQEVKALVLHVNLSDRTYVSGLNGKKKSLKIEVLFNGQLCDCRLITTHDARTRVKGPHQIFAGTRVDFSAERPWVVFPPGMAPDGSSKTNYKSASVPQRWQDICRALQSEAHERGANKEGEVPPTARFLEALASMQMPDQVHNMQMPGGKVFGAIDVVITAGEGRKIQTGQSLMKGPMRMPDRNYRLMRQGGSLTADPQMPHDEQNSGDLERQSLGPESGLLALNVDGDGHQEHEIHSENHALVSSSVSTEHQTATPSFLELARPNPHSEVPDDVRYPEGNSEHQYLAAPSSTHQGDFPSPHMPQAHPPLWSPLSDITRGQNTLGYSNGHLAQGNAAPCTELLDSFHINGHGPSYPPSIPHVGDIGVGLQQLGPNMLPMPYWSPQESLLGSSHARVSFQNENLLKASGQSSKGVQGFAPIPHSAQMAPSLVSHDTHVWPLMPNPPSGSRLVGPMPPVGLYSVTTKPKRSITSRKKPVSSQLKKSASVIFLRRLVILGQNKTILVERQWNPPKRLEVGFTMPLSAEGQPNLPESMNPPPELIRQKDTTNSIREPTPNAVGPSANSYEKNAQSGSGRARKTLPSSATVPSTEAPQNPVHNEPSSKSPSRKRRKTDHHTAVGKPRSSLGPLASHNPPLNQDCMIAYAESQDQTNEQGVVRQIRSEKAGHFEEDYVIFATRFFVGEG